MQILTENLYWVREHIFCTPTMASVGIYMVYYIYICIASIVLPAKTVDGHPHPKRGPRLKYTINGFKLTCLTVLICGVCGGVVPALHGFQIFRMSLIADEFWALWSTVNILALLASTLLYLKGRAAKSLMGEYVDVHSHGSWGLDFWVGRQLNPRIGTFDIKFVAYRVAMIFWLVVNLGFLSKQIETEGTVSYRMICYQLSTCFYIMDYFWNEQKMLTTWDIVSEEFGYMLVFGDYVFIPFTFSIQCHYLLGSPDFDNLAILPLILLLYFVGYYIFRTANSQKNQFKTDPTALIWGQRPRTIADKLLISGFWGVGRHINYTGDLIMALAYCLPCGWQLGGYFYVVYLTILLTHRAYRDDTKCKQKYGQLWSQYKEAVPYVFVPLGPIDAVYNKLGESLYYLTNSQEQVRRTPIR